MIFMHVFSTLALNHTKRSAFTIAEVAANVRPDARGGTFLNYQNIEKCSGFRDGTRSSISEIVGELQKDVAGLREDVSAIKAILPHFATKADIHKLETAMTRWLIGTLLGAGTL